MELYHELLINLLAKETITVHFEAFETTPAEILELACYKALTDIQAILKDDSLTDHECFLQIEKIVCLFEQLGSSCGNRHDWG